MESSFGRTIVTFVLCTILLGRYLCKAQPDPLPQFMYDNAMSTMKESMATAMQMLKDTLIAEARSTNHFHRFARRGARTRSFKFVQGFLGSTPYGKHLSYPSFVQLKTMAITRARHRMNNPQLQSMMSKMPPMLRQNTFTIKADGIPPRPLPDQCPYASSVVCDSRAPWRTYDGRCNNLRHPLWGASHQPLSRFLLPQYADALEAPRVSVTGAPLPSARLVSSTLHWDFDIPHPIHTLMLMQFGQFLDHDMSRTAITKLSKDPRGEGDGLKDVECGDDGCQTEGLENQACLPIPIPANDTDFAGQRCLMFVRSQDVPDINCRMGPRQQLNQLTSFLDASHVYGSTAKEAFELRDRSDPRRGRLLMRNHPEGNQYKPMLPADPAFQECRGDNITRPCFRAGDGRVNEFIGITTQHTMWAREHNRIEDILHRINPHWDGERLYQEARKIVAAVWQQLVYKEYLPLIVGSGVMQRYELSPKSEGFWNGYNENVNPAIANSFATAAMRYGHSQIQGMIKMIGNRKQQVADTHISFLFRDPKIMYDKPEVGCDALLKGLVTQPSQSMDAFITKQVSKHLFSEHPPHGRGEDLAALNIQRGREHGLPGYNSFRGWCGLPKATRFEDLSNEFPAGVIDRFRRLYSHVDDIDLFPAGISEYPYPGSLLGPTFSCIVGSQFRNLKFGDRFWFENSQHNPSPFSIPQLREIRKSSLAAMFCNNADSIKDMQPNVLLQPMSQIRQDQRYLETMQKFSYLYTNGPNENVGCQFIQQMDLSAWRETPPAPVPQFGPQLPVQHPRHPPQSQPHQGVANSLPRGPPPSGGTVTLRRDGLQVRVSSSGFPVRFAVGNRQQGEPQRTRSSRPASSQRGRNVNIRMNLRRPRQSQNNKLTGFLNAINNLHKPPSADYDDLLAIL